MNGPPEPHQAPESQTLARNALRGRSSDESPAPHFSQEDLGTTRYLHFDGSRVIRHVDRVRPLFGEANSSEVVGAPRWTLHYPTTLEIKVIVNSNRLPAHKLARLMNHAPPHSWEDNTMSYSHKLPH